MKRFLLTTAAVAFLPLAARAQMGLPGSIGAAFVPVTSPANCPMGSAFTDGCAGASVATKPLAGILGGYVKRPPWNVAGVDFGVGVPTGTSLIDVTTATLPTGCHFASPVVTCSSGTPTLSALDFTLHNGTVLNITSGSVTVLNSKFKVGSNSAGFNHNVMTASGTANITAKNNEFDGASVVVQAKIDQMLNLENTGTTDFEYDWFHDAGGDVIDGGAGVKNDIYRYNVFTNNGMFTTDPGGDEGHSDTIQYDMPDTTSAVNSADMGFNTVYTNYSTATQEGGEGLLTYQNGSDPSSPGGNGHNVSLHNNTLVNLQNGPCSDPGGVYSGNWVTGYVEGQPGDTNGRLANNYYDGSGADCFTGPFNPDFALFPNGFYGGSNGYFAQPMAVTNNVNMVSGATINTWPVGVGPPGYFVVPDAAGFTPVLSDIWSSSIAPTSGNVSTGSTIAITLHMDTAFTASGGTPSLTLNSGGIATLAGGNGTATLVFNNTVAAGNSANPLAVTAVNLNGATVKDSFGNLASLGTAVRSFTGVTVNNGASPTLAFTALANAPVNSTTPISGTYTVSAPSGLASATFGGASCSGTASITNFTASGGTWSATTTTPVSPCTGTETVTGTGSNTVTTAPSPAATFTSGGGGACPQGTADPNDGCSGAQTAGSVQHSNFFTGYTSVSYAHRPAWNVSGVDYPVGFTGTLTDASTATLPACASRSGSGSGPFTVTVNSAPCTLTHLDFSTKNGICVTDNASGSGTVTFDNDNFSWGTNCNINGGALVTLSGTAPVMVQYSQFTGSEAGAGGLQEALLQSQGTAPSSITVEYSAFINTDQADIQPTVPGIVNVHFNYAEGVGCCGNHGDWVIPDWAGTGVYNDSYDTVFSAGTRTAATTFCYVTAQNGAGTISGFCKNNTLVANGSAQGTVGFMLESDQVTVNSFTVTNNWIDSTDAFGYYTDQAGSTFNGPITCSGNKDLITGATATGTFLGHTCN